MKYMCILFQDFVSLPENLSDFSVNVLIIQNYINMIFQFMNSLPVKAYPTPEVKARNLVG